MFGKTRRHHFLKIVGWLLLGVFLLSPAAPAAARKLDLAATVAAGLRANPDVQSAIRVLSGSRHLVKAARGGFLPTLDLTTSFSRYSQTGDVPTVEYLDRDIFTSTVRITQPLFAGYAILSSYQKSRLQVEADAARLRQARLDLIYNIQLEFLKLLKLREDLVTANEAVERLKIQLSSATSFFKSGIGPHSDVLEAEVELSRARISVLKVKNQIRNQVVILNSFLNLPVTETVEYVGSLHDYQRTVPYDLESAFALALAQRADLVLGRKSIAIAKKDARLRFARYFPRVDLECSYQHRRNEYDNYRYNRETQDSTTVGVNLQWNLFDGGTTTYNYRSAVEHIAALEKSQEGQIAKARAAIVKAFTDIEDAAKLLDVAKKARRSAEESYRMAEARYQAHLGTMDDLFEAHFYLVRAATDISSAYMQYQSARSSLFYNIGIENPDLGPDPAGSTQTREKVRSRNK